MSVILGGIGDKSNEHDINEVIRTCPVQLLPEVEVRLNFKWIGSAKVD